MFSFKYISISFIISTILFKMTLSQNCQCPQSINGPKLISPSPMQTEALCKELASAIQSAVLSNMRRNSGKGPIFTKTGTSSSIYDTSRPVNGISGPVRDISGITGPILDKTGYIIGSNAVIDVPKPNLCPICASKCQNSLAKILGMTDNDLAKLSAILPISGANPVNMPIPYSSIISQNARIQDYAGPTSKNMNVPVVYPSSELATNNLAAAVTRSAPNNGNMLSEMIIIGNNMPFSSLRSSPYV